MHSIGHFKTLFTLYCMTTDRELFDFQPIYCPVPCLGSVIRDLVSIQISIARCLTFDFTAVSFSLCSLEKSAHKVWICRENSIEDRGHLSVTKRGASVVFGALWYSHISGSLTVRPLTEIFS